MKNFCKLLSYSLREKERKRERSRGKAREGGERVRGSTKERGGEGIAEVSIAMNIHCICTTV